MPKETENKKPEGFYEPGSISLESVMNRLSPCPFCGEKPWFEFQAEGPPEHGPNAYWPHQVIHKCKALGIPICVRAPGGRSETPDTVIGMWNSGHQKEVFVVFAADVNDSFFDVYAYAVATSYDIASEIAEEDRKEGRIREGWFIRPMKLWNSYD